MTSDLMAPAEVARVLGVSERTARRMGAAYTAVFSDVPLMPDPRNSRHRLYPPLAVERLQAAAALMRDHPALSTLEALTMLQTSRRPAPPRTPSAPRRVTLEKVLEAVQDLQAQVAALEARLTSSGPHLAPAIRPPASDAAPAPAAPPAASQQIKKIPARHRELLAALEEGAQLRVRAGGRTGETVKLVDLFGDDLRTVDARTVAVLTREGVLERAGQVYRLTAAAPR